MTMEIEKGKITGVVVSDFLSPAFKKKIDDEQLIAIGIVLVKVSEVDNKNKKVSFINLSHENDKEPANKIVHISISDPTVISFDRIGKLIKE